MIPVEEGKINQKQLRDDSELRALFEVLCVEGQETVNKLAEDFTDRYHQHLPYDASKKSAWITLIQRVLIGAMVKGDISPQSISEMLPGMAACAMLQLAKERPKDESWK